MSLKKRGDGSYVLRWLSSGRKPRKGQKGGWRQETLHGVSYAQALRHYKKRLAEAAVRSGRPVLNLTFGALADRYLSTHCPLISPGARARTESALNQHVLPAFGHRLIESLAAIDIEEFQQRRLAAGAAPATVRREIVIVRAILNKGEAWGIVDRNPIRRGAVKLVRVDNEKPIYFEPAEWSAFVHAFDDSAAWRTYVARVRRMGPMKVGAGAPSERRYGAGRNPDSEATAAYLARLRSTVPVFKALLYSGMRVSDVIALQWRDVSLDRGEITLRQKKTGQPLRIPISKALAAVLNEAPRGVGAARVFRRSDGQPFSYVDVARAFSVAKRLAGVNKELTVHSLRHTFGSWLAIQGTPLRTIQELLGHRDIRMTIRYSHLSPGHLRDAANTIALMERVMATTHAMPALRRNGNPAEVANA